MRVLILEDDPVQLAALEGVVRAFGHRVAVSLLLGTATGQEVLLDEIETKAARRLRNWLDRVGSRVRLVDHGHRCYGLHLST